MDQPNQEEVPVQRRQPVPIQRGQSERGRGGGGVGRGQIKQEADQPGLDTDVLFGGGFVDDKPQMPE